jgi:protein TonB
VVSTTATAPAADSVQPASAPAAAAVAAASSTAAPLAAAAAPAAAERPLQPLRRVEPEFPREAARQGIDQGTVLAQLRIGADGRVEAVTTSATGQSRVFERAARTALAEWSFPPGAPGRVYRVQLDFRR